MVVPTPSFSTERQRLGESVCLQGQPGSRVACSRTARATDRGCLKKAKQNKDLSLKINVDEKGKKNDWIF